MVTRIGGEVLGQSLSEKVEAISKALSKDCPCKLSGYLGVWVSPGKSKKVLRIFVERNGEGLILNVKNRKVYCGGGEKTRECMDLEQSGVKRLLLC